MTEIKQKTPKNEPSADELQDAVDAMKESLRNAGEEEVQIERRRTLEILEKMLKAKTARDAEEKSDEMPTTVLTGEVLPPEEKIFEDETNVESDESRGLRRFLLDFVGRIKVKWVEISVSLRVERDI